MAAVTAGSTGSLMSSRTRAHASSCAAAAAAGAAAGAAAAEEDSHATGCSNSRSSRVLGRRGREQSAADKVTGNRVSARGRPLDLTQQRELRALRLRDECSGRRHAQLKVCLRQHG